MEHPLRRAGCIDADGSVSEDQALTLLDYHDLYSFGLELNAGRIAQPLEAGLRGMQSATYETAELIRQLLGGEGSYVRFLQELDLHCVLDERQRGPLLQRHARLAASFDIHFWRPFVDYQPQDWAALSPYLRWLNAVQGGLAEALRHFFVEELGQMNLSFREAQVALSVFYRYHLAAAQRVSGRVFEEALPVLKTRVRVDFGAQTITILSAPQRPLRFEFTQIVHGMPQEELLRPRGYAGGARGQRYRRALVQQQVVSYDVPVPLDLARARTLGGELPQALEAAGAALNLAFGLLAAKEQLAAADIETWLDLGQNTLQALDKGAAFRASSMLARGGTPSPDLGVLARAGGRAASVLDAGRNAYAGYRVLYGDDSPIVNELEDGREFQAIAIGAKGAIQFTAGVTGGTLAAGELMVFGGLEATGFLAAAAGTVGIAVAFGGLLVATFDAVLAATERFGDHVTKVRAAWKTAERAELHGRRDPQTVERIQSLQRLVSKLR